MSATDRLRKHLKAVVALGVTKRTLAKACFGKSEASIGRWLDGTQNMQVTIEQAERIHAYLDALEGAVHAARASLPTMPRAPSEAPAAERTRTRLAK